MNGTTDYPLIREQHRCPICGHDKATGMLFCWPCQRGGKSIPDFGKVACDSMEAALAGQPAKVKRVTLRCVFTVPADMSQERLIELVCSALNKQFEASRAQFLQEDAC